MRKIKGLRWYMIALVTVGTVLGYLTRNAIAVAAPTLQDTMHITTQQYSYIIAAYSACYTIMQPVAGYEGGLRTVCHPVGRILYGDRISQQLGWFGHCSWCGGYG